MSFDINPLGTQMHLKQLDREAGQRSRSVSRNQSSGRPLTRHAAKYAGWIAAVTAVIALPWLVA